MENNIMISIINSFYSVTLRLTHRNFKDGAQLQNHDIVEIPRFQSQSQGQTQLLYV